MGANGAGRGKGATGRKVASTRSRTDALVARTENDGSAAIGQVFSNRFASAATRPVCEGVEMDGVCCAATVVWWGAGVGLFTRVDDRGRDCLRDVLGVEGCFLTQVAVGVKVHQLVPGGYRA